MSLIRARQLTFELLRTLQPKTLIHGGRCDPANWLCLLSLDLDFIGLIKLVNYVRSQVKAGNTTPDVSSKDKFDDDAYMKPVLENDALLYSLGDIEEEDAEPSGGDDAERRVVELQEDLERLQTQFTEYRLAVQRSMEEQLSQEDSRLSAGPSTRSKSKIEEVDSDYFVSYQYNGILLPYITEVTCGSSLTNVAYSNPRVHAQRCRPHRFLS